MLWCLPDSTHSVLVLLVSLRFYVRTGAGPSMYTGTIVRQRPASSALESRARHFSKWYNRSRTQQVRTQNLHHTKNRFPYINHYSMFLKYLLSYNQIFGNVQFVVILFKIFKTLSYV